MKLNVPYYHRYKLKNKCCRKFLFYLFLYVIYIYILYLFVQNCHFLCYVKSRHTLRYIFIGMTLHFAEVTMLQALMPIRGLVLLCMLYEVGLLLCLLNESEQTRFHSERVTYGSVNESDVSSGSFQQQILLQSFNLWTKTEAERETGDTGVSRKGTLV